MTDVAPDEDLLRFRRRLCRGISGAIVTAMREADTGFEDIAARLGCTASGVRRSVMRLVSGKAIPLDAVSDILWACNGAEIVWTVRNFISVAAPATAAVADENP